MFQFQYDDKQKSEANCLFFFATIHQVANQNQIQHQQEKQNPWKKNSSTA